MTVSESQHGREPLLPQRVRIIPQEKSGASKAIKKKECVNPRCASKSSAGEHQSPAIKSKSGIV